MNWDFIIFLAIVITPMGVFRGSFTDFLKYVEINVTETNIEALKDALSDYQVRESVKLLKNSKAYASYVKCLGTVADLNIPAFYELDKQQ